MSIVTRKSAWEVEELTQFRELVRKFLEAEAVPHDERWRKQKQVDRSFWKKAGELGLLCPSVPVEYGGGGGTYAHEAVVSEELGHASLASFGQAVHGPIAAAYLVHYGTEAQKQRWLPRMCTGELIGAIAMTEPGAGSDVQGLRTTAVRDGDFYVVNGAKTFITNGHLAGLYLTAVKTDPAKGAKGTSLLMIETDGLAGFSRGRSLDKIGMQGSDTAELFFQDARVPVSARLGEEGQGFAFLMKQLPQERLGIAVGAVASMERAVELTVAYVKERHAFGKPLLDLQNTRFKLAECAAICRASRALLDECIEKHVRGELTAAEASLAKQFTTDQQGVVLDECVQLHGGYGYMQEYAVARMWADARVQRIYGGANEIMKELVARAL
jgi:acyl-CoA dehydrogenase